MITGYSIRYTLDPKNPPKVTAAQRRRREMIAKMPDEDIDYSDIPPSGEGARWTRLGLPTPSKSKDHTTPGLDDAMQALIRHVPER